MCGCIDARTLAKNVNLILKLIFFLFPSDFFPDVYRVTEKHS